MSKLVHNVFSFLVKIGSPGTSGRISNFACAFHVPDVFLSFEFLKDRKKNVGAVGVEISLLPLKRHIAYTTACCYRSSRDTRPTSLLSSQQRSRVGRVDKAQGAPKCRGPPSSRQNPLHYSTEFCVHCAIKFVHGTSVKISGGRPLKGIGGEKDKERKGKERGPPGYFVLGPGFL